MSTYSLESPLVYLKGVGPHRSDILAKDLGLATFSDLLYYFPFRYIDRTRFYKIKDVDPSISQVQILGRLTSLTSIGVGRKRRLVGQLKDETGLLELVWFQSVAWLEKSLKIGSVYIVFGKATIFNQQISMTHPEMDIYNPKVKLKGSQRLQPVYSTTEKLKKLTLDSKGIQRLVLNLMENVYSTIPESLPAYILAKYKLISLKEALGAIHFPSDEEALVLAIRRLKFEELFFLQLKMLKAKALHQQKYKGAHFPLVGEYFNDFYDNKLPFKLTNAQKRVLKEIRKDTLTGAQMNRLLQGDVGSGKTVVALMSILLAIDNGCQACLMAPTEILARQHYEGIAQLLGGSSASIGILTGSTKQKERKEIHQLLLTGELDILVGTHALLEDIVQFKNLGLVVIDEQHRFGVEQRAKLWRKNTIPPHMLVMTATPIPRTLAMTLYGDLDVSVIDELPAGRKPIQTMHLYESSRLKMFGLMRKEIEKGRQVYVVYPLIEESEKLDLLYLEAGIDALSREFPRPNYQLSIVHGRLTAKEKEMEMQRFVKGETQIMVATTVIEVGVNVPNASVMVIENSERFGLSQLHQLRGRVGRGAEQSFCILMSTTKLSREGRIRLETMVRTTDGFEIAETDLKLRGPGNMSGTQQSGVLELKIADIATDQSLLQEVRDEVISIFENDPDLILEENEVLKNHLQQQTMGIAWEKIS